MWFITSNPCNEKHLGRANNWGLSEVCFYWKKKQPKQKKTTNLELISNLKMEE